MCAEFLINTSTRKIQHALGTTASLVDVDWNQNVRLYQAAPVLRGSGPTLSIDEVMFSLKPPGTKYPTFNARLASWDEARDRIMSISEKPTWKGPLERTRCLVPMTSFIEPVYRGENAGRMVGFHPQNDDILFCAGLYEETADRQTGEVYIGFALILHSPSLFMIEQGHHRQPVFLKGPEARRWIDSPSASAQAAAIFLAKNRYLPELRAEPDRAMAKGWEKRVADSASKLASELSFMEKMQTL